MQSYPLDLDTMLYFLGQQHQSGRLEAALEQVPGIRVPCQAILTLSEGKISTCFLRTGAGKLVAQGNEALRLLASLGTIEWRWQPQELSLSSPRLAALPQNVRQENGATVPRLTGKSRGDLMHTYTRNQLRVLGLIDGKRSVNDIARVLAVGSTQLPQLWSVLHELEAMGVVLI
jgi:hypothetical protein